MMTIEDFFFLRNLLEDDAALLPGLGTAILPASPAVAKLAKRAVGVTNGFPVSIPFLAF